MVEFAMVELPMVEVAMVEFERVEVAVIEVVTDEFFQWLISCHDRGAPVCEKCLGCTVLQRVPLPHHGSMHNAAELMPIRYPSQVYCCARYNGIWWRYVLRVIVRKYLQ